MADPVSGAADGASNLLHEKGPGGVPMPVIIGVVVGGGWLLYRRSKSSSTASAATASQAATSTDSTDPYSAVGTGGWTSTPDPLAPTDSSTSTTSTTTITDNEQWATQAEQWLLGQNYDPALVDQAVRAYIAGNTLDANEQAVINMALKQFGPLPTPLPPTGNTTTTPVTPAPKPVTSTPTPAPTTKAKPTMVVGQVSPYSKTGEKVVAVVPDTTGQGYYYLLDSGGIDTSGDAKLPSLFGGSYLGYVASKFGIGTAQSKAEIANNGDFSKGSLKVLAGGHLAETNNRGEVYTF